MCVYIMHMHIRCSFSVTIINIIVLIDYNVRLIKSELNYVVIMHCKELVERRINSVHYLG